MMYGGQIIMLYILNLCSAVCQLYLNITGKKQNLSRKNIQLHLLLSTKPKTEDKIKIFTKIIK